ncbi:DUF1016 domain-containing protein [Chitinophaga agrisoli]|uniref:DUF1016 domain-containing protein n=2 Tax=Chitinophaga agrisoli TaxID=2607653 RepID=A0A5B2W3E2_9BACT|nr:DUF1016 domain-containing protein [Chitinophaga agrisoli]
MKKNNKGKTGPVMGEYLIKYLAEQLQPEFGSGFSKRYLELFRQFFRTFPIANSLSSQLTRTHYKLLVRTENQQKRDFYITGTAKNHWTVRQLERQINSQLYERLLMSSDKESVLAVANGEQPVHDAKTIIKDPLVLEFLGLKRESSYYEKDLGGAIINNLQEFLLELGNGFAFIARQKRIHLEGDDFFVDLVCYNRLLQCFVLFEIKTGKLTHQDLGQLQMYVNYFDRIEKQPFENRTIGVLLCAEKNNAVVKFTLPEDNKNIVASKYQLYMPTEQQLIAAMEKEIERFQ